MEILKVLSLIIKKIEIWHPPPDTPLAKYILLNFFDVYGF